MKSASYIELEVIHTFEQFESLWLFELTPNQIFVTSECNGASKTTVSYTILPEILDGKEFANANETAKGFPEIALKTYDNTVEI